MKLSLLNVRFLRKKSSNFVLKMHQVLYIDKVSYKTHVSNLMHFQDKMVHLFFFLKKALKSEIIYKNTNKPLCHLHLHEFTTR